MAKKIKLIHFTFRESQILKLTLNEKSNEFIAEKFGISKRTVEGVKNRIYKKTKTKSALALFKYALKNGLYKFKF